MKRTLPPLNALRAFEAAGRLGSFKEAAAELHVTHGAVSQQVRLLEEWLGASLFERHNRRVVLTPAAEAYLAEVGPLFEQLSQATARYGLLETVSRTLSVNAPATFTLRWLVPRLAQFRAEHPDVDVKVETSNELVESLKEIYDVVIRGGPDTFYGYSMQLFLSEERLPVCSPALLQRLPLRTPDDLREHTLLHTSSLPRLWPDWLARAQISALRPAATLTFDHFYLTLQAAIDGIGIAMGPTALVSDDLATGRLVAPFAGPRLPSRSYCTYVPDGRSADDVIVLFRSWLEREGMRSRTETAP
ncbi:transcriptional regulator GcvA [Paraburkholderia nemoris]|jgi:Transcriptional regulator|uniref:Glycine cleavage system transcriptional activator n=1 Tax=Paraburkholderia nemoris TaxID=2793076 RepID=A0ABM8QGU8_9BURK|nr:MULTISPECIES: transcriptional regulator GcvA [Paraburkholderia]KPD15629.1 transcriptional regulator [Burkholderia sp. ST111]MBK3813752.1 transcriptional regulator GcvA [Paraburkholderia aspalathi]CAE6695508.1 Glycine cleavage system transcriptional activator [Paraburkholderia nemoris]CAE6734441.1 Glycine cleavage system transcriptional activator [Paraburkholderia nemoris]CAE6794502.1 Glycine cleavage system transcriptional activator [Paraburkholderia nemoris]